MTTYTFGNGTNDYVEVVDETYVDPLGTGRTRMVRAPAGVPVKIKNYVGDVDLADGATRANGQLDIYNTDGIAVIKVSADDFATFRVLFAEQSVLGLVQVVISQISASGTADDTTFLRGDGAWAQPTVGSITPDGIEGATDVGKEVLTAADGDAIVAAIGALAEAAASDFGKTLIGAADADAARTALQALGSNDVPAYDLSTPLEQGDFYAYDSDSDLLVPTPQTTPTINPLFRPILVLNPGDPLPPDTQAGTLEFVYPEAAVLGATVVGQGGSQSAPHSVTVALTDGIDTTDNLLVFVSGSSPGSLLSAFVISDTKGNTSYAQRGARLQGATIQTQIWKMRPTTALVAGDSVTVALPNADTIGDMEVILVKVTGLAAEPALDQQSVNSGIGVTQVTLTTPGSTGEANELAFVSLGFNQDANDVNVPAGWTQLGTTQTSGGSSPRYCAVLYKVLTTIGSVSVTPTIDVSGALVGVLDTFKAA